MPPNLPDKVQQQIDRAGLPQSGNVPFEAKLITNRRGEQVIAKVEVKYGSKKGKKGYMDTDGRIWVRDRGHAQWPDHWDVPIDEGRDYIRVDDSGNVI